MQKTNTAENVVLEESKQTEKTNQIIHGDCIENMKTLKDECADIVICDPHIILGKTSEMIATNKKWIHI